MNNDILSEMEFDTIGEILNISMGAAATAISTMLDRQVNITTPTVSVVKALEFDCAQLEPAEGIEIEYIEGLSGSNFMIMKRRDIRAIVDLLISGEGNVDSDEELDDIHVSAVSEIMNQMMGASSTALANFFGKSINISTPRKLDLSDIRSRMSVYGDGNVVSVKFLLIVEGLINSEFITILPINFTKELVANALNFNDSAAASAAAPAPEPEPAPAPAPRQAARQEPPRKAPEPAPQPVQRVAPQPRPQPVRPVQPVNVKPLQFESFDEEEVLDEESMSNFNLILSVPLEITVEIGRTKKPVKEILDFRIGTVLELNKMAGDPVDVIVNGQLMAKGDVVVIDDSFGVRITDILSTKELASKINT